MARASLRYINFIFSTLFSLTHLSCAQGPELLDKRTSVSSSQDLKQSFRVVKNFESTKLADTELQYTSQYRSSKQTLVMERRYENVQEDFKQINRPILSDQFSQGSLGSKVEDNYAQNNFGILDILIVVDNSHSMQEEHEKLSKELPSLLSHVDKSNWQIAIATTDPADGCISKVIRKSDENPQAVFEKTILETGVAGTGDESGFLQISNAIDCASQWLREDSNLGIIVVSDEDNCSDGSLCAGGNQESADISYITEKLAKHRTMGEDLRVYGLFWKPSDSFEECNSAFRPAYLYQELVRQSQGTSGSICDGDYSNTFQTVSQDLFAKLKYQFSLSQTPIPNSLAVSINDQVVESGFEVNNKILRFNEAPPIDAKIKISYRFGESTMKSTFKLSKTPDESSFQLSINGLAASPDSYRLIGSELHFNTEPPEGSSINTNYRENIQLPNSYQLKHSGTLSSLSLSKEGVSFDGFQYSPEDGVISFDIPPRDGDSISIAYKVPGPAVLSYESGLPVSDSPVDLRAYRANDPSVDVAVAMEGQNFKFAEEDFIEEDGIVVEYRDPSDNERTFSLPHIPLEKTLWIKTNISDCENSNFKLESRVLKTTCFMEDGEHVLVKYKYILKHLQEFTLTGLEESKTGIWNVFVNDKRVEKFSREGNILKFQDPLPLHAKVRVEIIDNM